LTEAPHTVSVIIPTLNEEKCLPGVLRHLLSLEPDEVIVADGGSQDSTPEIASQYARLVRAPRGRGSQMNAGAAAANGAILLFLHADARLGEGALDAIRNAMQPTDVGGGCFDVHFDGDDLSSRAFTLFGRLRRTVGIVYGDSGIFCRRSIFEELGGYKLWPIMEDYEFYRRLLRLGKAAPLAETIHVSDRRWRGAGLTSALRSWVWIQGLYWLGVSPHRLARMYRDVR